MFKLFFKIISLQFKKYNTRNYPCKVQGNVNIIEKSGGVIQVNPTATLNSLQEGYHVGIPFETTLLADRPGSMIQIGEYCRIHGTYIHACDKIIIGKKVLIAAGTNIIDSNGHSSNARYARFRQNFQDVPKSIIIRDFVWIGMNCLILKGVEIGECSIISAGSVVKEYVPPFSVVEGNPAKVVHTFNPNEALPEDYPIEKLSAEEKFFNY